MFFLETRNNLANVEYDEVREQSMGNDQKFEFSIKSTAEMQLKISVVNIINN